MLTLIVRISVAVLVILSVRAGIPWILHEIFQVGHNAATRYRAASVVRWMAQSLTLGPASLHELHYALDIVLCGNQLRAMQTGTADQERFWRLGRDLAVEIRDRQGELSIDHVWFAHTYEEACFLLRAS